MDNEIKTGMFIFELLEAANFITEVLSKLDFTQYSKVKSIFLSQVGELLEKVRSDYTASLPEYILSNCLKIKYNIVEINGSCPFCHRRTDPGSPYELFPTDEGSDVCPICAQIRAPLLFRLMEILHQSDMDAALRGWLRPETYQQTKGHGEATEITGEEQ